jgi:hypothetical protein
MVRLRLTPAAAIAPSTVSEVFGLKESPGKGEVVAAPGGHRLKSLGTLADPEHGSAPVCVTFQVSRKSIAFTPAFVKS